MSLGEFASVLLGVVGEGLKLFVHWIPFSEFGRVWLSCCEGLFVVRVKPQVLIP